MDKMEKENAMRIEIVKQPANPVARIRAEIFDWVFFEDRSTRIDIRPRSPDRWRGEFHFLSHFKEKHIEKHEKPDFSTV